MERRRRVGICFSILFAAETAAFAWGGRGHGVIHRIAATTLRLEAPSRSQAATRIADLVTSNAEFFLAEADLPDRDRALDRIEAPNHFLDLEAFGPLSFLRDLPASRPATVPDSAGRLPWTLAEKVRDLRVALREGRPGEALALAARIGHYIGDAHVPLHTTVFYDGREETEAGIHARWESQTVDAMEGLETLAPMPRMALPLRPPDRPLSDSELVRWVQVLTARTIAASHRLLPGVFGADEEARLADPTLGETYLAVMRREEGATIRARLALAARALVEILFAAADDPETVPFSQASAGEMRLDLSGIETGPRGVLLRLVVRRLGPMARGETSLRLVLPDRRLAPSLGESPGDTREVLVLLPWRAVRWPIEVRLEPLDRLSPADNVLRIQNPSERPRGPRRQRRN